MSTPQPNIFAPLASCHRHLEYRLDESVLQSQYLANQLRPLISATLAAEHAVIGFGHRLWAALSDAMPAELKPFSKLGPAESTQADIWLWLAADNHSAVLDTSMALHRLLQPYAQLVREIDGQQYHQSRDLTGFEDGSANPKTDDARQQAACIPTGEVGAGGSYVLTQQWLHDLPAFNAQPVSAQEGIIGRTKKESVELEGDAMPVNSHVSRTDVKLDGIAQKVWRRSIPWGGVENNGLYFVGFACELKRLEIQLERMFGLTDDGVVDQLTQYSKPMSSSWWYTPSLETLTAL